MMNNCGSSSIFDMDGHPQSQLQPQSHEGSSKDRCTAWLRSLGFTRQLMSSEKLSGEDIADLAIQDKRVSFWRSASGNVKVRVSAKLEELILKDPVKNGVLLCLLVSRMELARVG